MRAPPEHSQASVRYLREVPPRGLREVTLGRVFLVVDDEPAVREVAALMLEDLGCEVVQARNGRVRSGGKSPAAAQGTESDRAVRTGGRRPRPPVGPKAVFAEGSRARDEGHDGPLLTH